MKDTSKILVGKPEEKRPVGRPGRRWEANIIMNLKETERESVDWVCLAQGSVQWRVAVKMVMKVGVS
jgi:hypothetical protein